MRAGICFFLAASLSPLRATLFDNLQNLPDRIAVGDPLLRTDDSKEGPKGIATADFNGDGMPDLAVGNLDATITILINQSDFGHVRFSPPQHLRTGAKELRSVIAADLNGDGKPDLAAASPVDGQIVVYINPGNGIFARKTTLEGWVGIRCLAAGDFDGDGKTDLAAAGTGLGVRHFRGTGGGNFEIMGDLPRLSPRNQNLTQTRPVYAMRAIKSQDGRRDDLLVTHAETPELWILSTVPADYSAEPAVVADSLPAWKDNPSPVLIHEVQVHNAATLRDADGTFQPWVELLNKSGAAVNLSGWKLRFQTADWPFPAVTIQPGRFLVVFLSGKGRRNGPELHTSSDFILKESTDAISLISPNGTTANTIDLPKHLVNDVTRGLAPDSGSAKWFDVPSPGAVNNAGIGGLEDFGEDPVATLTITPRNPAPGQPVTVRVEMPVNPSGNTIVRTVWFAATPDLTESYHPMHRIAAGVAGVSPAIYQEVLTSTAFIGSTPHRVLARLRDKGTSNDYTVEVNRGLDEAEATSVVQAKTGSLRPVASVPSPKVKSFDIGPVITRLSSPGAPADLVYVDDEAGELRVHRSVPGVRRFEASPSPNGVRLVGKPRDVKLADVDGDGWLDAVAVLYADNKAVNCRNEGGFLKATGELPTGRSPRELVMADFTGDGLPDAAVINRDSGDVSILPSAPNATGLVSSDQIYAVEGEVSALRVEDYDHDGRADAVIQLLRKSGEISVRKVRSDGKLDPETVTDIGAAGASALTLEDVNGDGNLDVISANLGTDGAGSISVLLAKQGGGYALPVVINASGPLFAIATGDFNNDTHTDVVAGLFDCTVQFFFGNGDGTFAADSYDVPVPFINESRTMVTGDFNKDGRLDIAGAGYEGDMVVLENLGASTGGKYTRSWKKYLYPAPSPVNYGANRIALTRINNDDYWDLIIGTGHGVILYQGGRKPDPDPDDTDVYFTPAPLYDNSNTNFAVSDVVVGDLDGVGGQDMVEACEFAACINLLTQVDGRFVRTTSVDVPSARFLATGDLDGDGLPDLVGTGDVLWTVLSSKPSQLKTPVPSSTARPQLSGVLINEILGRNTGIPVPSDNWRNTDFIELFNSTAVPVSLAGWKLRVQSSQEGTPFDRTWTLPAIRLNAGSHIVLNCAPQSDPPVPGELRTGFALPAEGGTVSLLNPDKLLNPDNLLADSVTYPHAQENVSWGRFVDGHPSFCANPVPSPGLSNLDGGEPPPEVSLILPSPSDMLLGGPLKFIARGRDDLGIVSMSLVWNRLDQPMSSPKRTVLYDNGPIDGVDDGPPLDGVFAGMLEMSHGQGLPAGAEVQFYLEAVDLSGNVLRLPEDAKLTEQRETRIAWTFSLTTPPKLAIVEVCTNNASLQRDERGGNPDYVKVRNTGSAPVAMSAVMLAKSSLSPDAAVFSWPEGMVLLPGAESTVFADANPEEGRLHAPFTLDSEGDDLSLFATTPSGARLWIHSLTIPEMAADERYVALPGTSPVLHAAIASSENLQNWVGIAHDENGTASATAHFLAAVGINYLIEGDAPGDPQAWEGVATITGDGAMHTVQYPLTEISALRIIPSGGLPVPRVDAVIPAANGAGIFGEAAGAAQVTLFCGLSDGGAIPENWEITMSSPGGRFGFDVTGLVPNTPYFFRLRAGTTAGDVWSSGAGSILTLPAGTPSVSSLALTRLNPTNAIVMFRIDPAPPFGTPVTLLAGTTDAFANAWPINLPATPSITANTWTVPLNALARETDYVVRVRSGGGPVSAVRLRFRTPDAAENLIANLRLSEIMYNPASPTPAEIAAGYDREDFEYIELQNTSSEPADLKGLWFEGLGFDFPPAGAAVVPSGGFAVIAAHPFAFAMRYGGTIPLAGWTLHPFRNTRLANDGELLALHLADGRPVFSLTYRDDLRLADNRGHSLEYHENAGPWREEETNDYFESLYYGGSPGFRPDRADRVTYNSWKATKFGLGQPNNSISAMDADADLDGLSNFAEYACGTHPLIPNSPNVLGLNYTVPSDVVFFPANLEAVDALILLESTQSMSQWTVEAAYSHDDLYQFYGQPWAGDWKQVRVSFPVTRNSSPASATPKFYRLRIIKR